MKKHKCSSDIGSVLVGTKEFLVPMPNRGGDGTTTAIICKEEEKLDRAGFGFFATIEGAFNLYSYDCSRGDAEDALKSYKGIYDVYRGKMSVLFETSSFPIASYSIGTFGFKVSLPGAKRVDVIDKKVEKEPEGYEYRTTVEGDFQIFDIEGGTGRALSGRYSIYFNKTKGIYQLRVSDY